MGPESPIAGSILDDVYLILILLCSKKFKFKEIAMILYFIS